MNVYEQLRQLKIDGLTQTMYDIQRLQKHPHLSQLFLEMTDRCNLACEHCGSSCSSVGADGVPVDVLRRCIQQLKSDIEYKDDMPYIILTGGEPLMRKDWRDVVHMLHSYGLPWGMTTNGTLVTAEDAKFCVEHGLYSVAVSIDGTQSYHDTFRGVNGSFERALRGLQHFIDAGVPKSNITTVLNKKNIVDIDAIYEIVSHIDVDTWRLMSIEPIGRARDREDLLLDGDDYVFLMNYIVDKRRDNIPVEFGCMHYLGLDFERDVRDWFYYCGAGIQVASIMANGDIGACLDIERNSETIQGNIYQDAFLNVWRNRFSVFRQNLSETTDSCSGCSHAKYCRGGAHHTYDHVAHIQRLCMKGVLFD